jgi:aryl sulfotransferase
LHLIFQDLQHRALGEFSPWLDFHFIPPQESLAILESQKHRRCIKSHLPLDGIPYFPQVKYIVVARDARDVFMSLWNHYTNLKPEFRAELNRAPGLVGDPIPDPPNTPREFWQSWMTRGWFAWETEGYPFWTNLHYTQTWWDFRHLPNVLLVHYNDLTHHLEGEIRRIADYLDIKVSEEMLLSIAHAVKFSSMKQNAAHIVPHTVDIFKGGPQTFINKGTNGRWREVLTDDDLRLYTAAAARELSPDCAAWLERGRLS